MDIGEPEVQPWDVTASEDEIINEPVTGVVYCSICPGKTFITEDVHQKYMASEKKEYFCLSHSSCAEKFTKHELVNHCYESGIEIRNWDTYFRKALKENTNFVGRIEESCEICYEMFKNKTDLKNHYQIHEDRYSCQACNVGFKKVMDYICHAQKHNQNKLFTCPLCEITTEKRILMQEHIDTHEQFKRYKCKTCEKVFASYAQYFYHINNVEKQKKAPKEIQKPANSYQEACEICFKLFNTKAEVETHYETHEDQHTCHVCKATFKKIVDYVCHVRLHHGKHLFTCPLCKFATDKLNLIKKHLEIHDEFKRYRCTMCSKKFPSYTIYYDHAKYYHNNEVFVCETCGERLKTPRALGEHEAAHRWEASGKMHCPECNLKVASYSSMKNHYSTYHPSKRI